MMVCFWRSLLILSCATWFAPFSRKSLDQMVNPKLFYCWNSTSFKWFFWLLKWKIAQFDIKILWKGFVSSIFHAALFSHIWRFIWYFLASFIRFGSTSTTPAASGDSKVVLQETIPGFREPGVIATDYEVAAGLERYELLKTLRGEDPWEDLHPINITAKGTVKNPIIVRGELF